MNMAERLKLQHHHHHHQLCGAEARPSVRSFGTQTISEGDAGDIDPQSDGEESVAEEDLPENKALFPVTDEALSRWGIKRPAPLGFYKFPKDMDPWQAIIKMNNPSKVSARDIISCHVRNGHLTWKPTRSQAPQGWRILPEFPTSADLLSEEPPELLENTGRYASKDEYLETQYRLYRFEGTELLRRAIATFRRNPRSEGRDFFVYTQVHVQGYHFSKLGAACQVSFSTEMSETKVLWEDSTRLTPGTLVALSTTKDRFRTKCLVAVVASRAMKGGLIPDPDAGENENTPPRINIFWAEPEGAVVDPGEGLIMIETRGGFYEAVRFAMLGLQHAALQESKFDKYLIDGCRDDADAEYLDDLEPALPLSTNSFDDSQARAFRRMTSKEMTIIQGPPGTGKTFTSIVAIESLIKTFAQCHEATSRPPIIVAAQTNHALDQLLAECIKCDAKVVRLGGRSTDEVISEKTLYNWKKDSKFTRGQKVPAEGSSNRIGFRFKDWAKMCFPSEGLISAEVLYHQGVISEKQLSSLKNAEWDSALPASDMGSDIPVNVNRKPLEIPDGTEKDILLDTWLDQCIEEDRTYVYKPPQGQTEPTPADELDLNNSSREGDEGDDDDQKDRLRGEFIPLKFHLTGALPGASKGSSWVSRAARLLRENDDMYQIKPSHRGMVYRYLRQQLVAKMTAAMPRILTEYQKTCDSMKISGWETNVKVIQGERIEVLGCTTTGLTKYRGLIAALKPRVLLIEEAAETREPHITSALFPSLDQLILVGDHQQLVPHVDVRQLGFEPYNLNVSLFERFVKLGLPFAQLQVQRRMVPAIREVVQVFYPNLRDHAIVRDPSHRPAVPGIDQRLWWFQHSWVDSRNEAKSFTNLEEAKMIVGFAQYLVQNGMQPNEITILTFYNGQVDLIISQLKRNDWFRVYHPEQEWKDCVRTVDGFQGEQNEIILLSIVRSRSPSEQAVAGFVENENRAVVALSRAKRGLFVFGNANNLLQSTPQSKETWEKVFNVFQGNTDHALPVTCQNHHNTTEIKDPDGWHLICGGGCRQRCDKTCPNGHPCELPCHIVEQSKICCRQPCEKTLPCGHGCVSSCGEACKCPHGCDAPKLKSVSTIPSRPRQQTRPQRTKKNGLPQRPKQSIAQATTNPVPKQALAPAPPKSAATLRPASASLLTSAQLMEKNAYRERFCKPESKAKDAVHQPLPTQSHSTVQTINETFIRTTVTPQGARIKVEKTETQYTSQSQRKEEDLLIDFGDDTRPSSSASSYPLIDLG